MSTQFHIKLSKSLWLRIEVKSDSSWKCFTSGENGRNSKVRINNKHPITSCSPIVIRCIRVNWYSICMGIYKSTIFVANRHLISNFLHYLHSYELDQCKKSRDQNNPKNINFGDDPSVCLGNWYHNDNIVKITYKLFWFLG